MTIHPWSGVGSGRYDWPLWDDLRFPASGINPSGSANPPDVDGNNAGTFLFSTVADEIIGVVAQMPHAWRAGSAIHPHIHWAPTTANAGNVYWRLGYKIIAIGGDLPANFTTNDQIVAAAGVSGRHQVTGFDYIDMTGYDVSVVILFTIMRKGDAEALDTYGDDARLFEFDVHYQSDKLGTVVEFPS